MKSGNVYTLLFFFLPIVLGIENNVHAQNWPMLNYNKERTSWAADENVLHPPLELKKEVNTKTGGQKMGDISFYQNLLCLAVQKTPNTLEVHDIILNDTLWTFEVPHSGGSMSFTCAQNDSFIFAGGQQGTGLYALYRETGKEKWHKPMGTLYTKNIILDSTRVYILGDSLYCLNIADGTTLWSEPMSVQSTPAVDDFYVYVTGRYKLRIFNKFSGKLSWERPISEWTTAGIALDELNFYTHSNDTIFAYNKESWDIKWIYPSLGDTLQYNAQNSIAITDDKLCFTVNTNGQGNGQLVTLDKNTGEFLWEQTFAGNYVFAPAIANDVVYIVPFKEAALYGFDLQNGQLLFFDNSIAYRNQPIIANHELYAVALDRIVVFRNISSNLVYNDKSIVPHFTLSQNYPNPFNPVTSIHYVLPVKSQVTLNVFDINGRRIKTLVNTNQSAGDYQVDFNATNLTSGIYFYQLNADSYREIKRMLLIK